MSVWNVLSRVRHDGQVYEAGSKLVDITDEAAKLLEEAGAIEKTGEQVVGQVEQDTATVEGQVAQDEQEVKAEKQSLLSKAKAAVSGQPAAPAAPSAPPAPAQPAANQPVEGQPSAQEVANTAAQVQ